MDAFWKIVAILMVCAILMIVIKDNNPSLALLLSVAGCILTCVLAARYLGDILNYLSKIQTISKMDTRIFQVLLKTSGIALIAEFSAQVLSDAGYGSQAKLLKFAGTAVIIWLSLPLLEQFLDLITGILGEL